MKKQIFIIFIIVISLILGGAGCITFSKGGNDRGVFKTTDRGESWQHKVAVAHIGTRDVDISAIDINDLEIDPSDSGAVYAATKANGIFYTYNGGESWLHANSFLNKEVKSIAVDFKDKCNIYAAIDNKIYKTEDCSRTWQLIYDDPRADNTINTLDIDAYNSQIIYAGSYRGDVLKSLDGGKSWKAINRFKTSVEKVLIDQAGDTRNVYVATRKNGVYKTIDAGGTWQSSEEILGQYKDGLDYRAIVYQKDGLILATEYGLFKTANSDDWQNWKPLDLVTAPSSILIYSLAVNPQNINDIYYGTDKTFYRTNDGGRTWATKSLPSTGAATALLVDYQNPEVIYLAITKLKK